MAENNESTVASTGEREHHEESLLDKIADKFHHHDDSSSSSSSSDSEDEKKKKEKKVKEKEKKEEVSKSEEVKAKAKRLFGREKPVHQVLGGGKPADVMLWRNKKVSAGILGTATAIWILFELLEYHLLTLICHILIFSLAILFLWTNACTFIHKSPPRIPEISLPEEPFVYFASALRFEINRGFFHLREIASGRELKRFLAVIVGLWVLSILGSSCSFLTLFYFVFVVLHTVPALYERHEDKVDPFAERAFNEAKKHYGVVNEKAKMHYGVVNEKYLSKLPLDKLPRVPYGKKSE